MTPNTRAFKFVKEISLKLKLHIESHILIMGDTALRFGQAIQTKSNREILDLINVISQIYRTFHPKNRPIFFSLHLMELSLKLTTYSYTKQMSRDTRKLKLLLVSYLLITH